MRKQITIPQEVLKKYLHYDPDTGVFTWKRDIGYKMKKGMEAGCTYNDGHITIYFDRKPYQASRLAHLFMTGRLPDGRVTHLNGRNSDNSWDNLYVRKSLPPVV